MKYQAVLFDFDFTLADATPGIVLCVNHALNLLSLQSKGTDEIRKTVGLTLGETFHALTGIADEELAARFAALFREMADQVMTKNTVIFEDAVKLLPLLQAEGCKTGIVTSKYHYRIDEALAKYGMSDRIDCIVGFEDVETAKPSPEGLLRAMESLAQDRDRVLYIGDSLIDAKTAQNAGVDFAAVTTGATTASDFAAFPHIAIADSLTSLFHTLGLTAETGSAPPEQRGELWDIYDRDGNRTGRTKVRGEALLDGEYIIGASLWIASSEGKLLIQKRSAAKRTHPGKWSITGGAILSGETSAAGCVREVAEEIGLVLAQSDIAFLARSHGRNIIFDDYIVVRDFPAETAVLQREEVSEIRWVTPRQVRDMFEAGDFMFEDIGELDKVEAYIRAHLR